MEKSILLGGAIIAFSLQIQAKERPNIVIFLADDLGYGDVKWTNPNAYIETPNMDRLAKNGMILANCYSSAPMSSPSRAGLLTGRTPMRMGIQDWIKEIEKLPKSNVHLQAKEVTFAELLKTVGYQTALFGKWHLNNAFNTNNGSDPEEQGFDYWFATEVQSNPSHKNPVNFYENNVAVGAIGSVEKPQYSANIVAEKTISYLSKIDKKDPFLTYVAFHEPHVVCDAPEELKKKYLKKIANGDIPLLKGTGEKGLGQAEYYACVENMDIAIGRVVEFLKGNDLLDNTLILFSSDNGPDSDRRFKGRLQSVGSPTPFEGRKHTLFEGGIHQASFVHWQNKLQGGGVEERLVGHVDVLPTIASIVGIHLPSVTIDGEDVSPMIQKKRWQRNKPLHWHFYCPRGDSPQSVMRDGDYIVTADWTEKFPMGRYNVNYAEKIKKAELMNFKLYKYEAGIRVPITDEKKLEQMKKALILLHADARDESPGAAPYSWNKKLEKYVEK